MKSVTYVLAGLIGAGAVAGATLAVIQQPQISPSPRPTSVQSSEPTASSSSNPATDKLKSTPRPDDANPVPVKPTQPTATTEAQPTRQQTSPSRPRQTVRQVKSCQVLMAIVNDTNPPLNVRSQPSTDSRIVGTLQDGMFVSVKQEQNGWFEIAEPAGWIAKSKTVSQCGQKVEQVQFGAGQTGATIADEFFGSGSHKYKLSLAAGQALSLQGNVGPMPAVIAPNGQYLVGMDDSRSQNWSTKLPASGEYTFELDSNFRGYKYEFSINVH